MNKWQWIYGLLIVVFLAVIGTSGYYLLGGFEKITVYELSSEARLIAGRQFSGRQTSDLRNEWFSETRQLLKDSTIRGTLTVVNYTSDTLAGNELSQFIGFALKDSIMGEIPVGYEVREFETEKRLAIFLDMHWFVKPGPGKIESLLSEEAARLNLILQPYFIEIYYYDDSMSVEAWSEN